MLERCTTRLAGREPTAEETSLHQLVAQHEDMHAENLTMIRQILGCARPTIAGLDRTSPAADAAVVPGDVEVPGGTHPLGASRDEPFVFDNEKWAHPVDVPPLRISNVHVTIAKYAEFVEDGGYTRRTWWGKHGWEWTASTLEPYPGFVAGVYAEYSEPYFGKKPVLRGGGWTTRSRLIRNTWRSFFMRHRRNVVPSFRTCSLEA